MKEKIWNFFVYLIEKTSSLFLICCVLIGIVVIFLWIIEIWEYINIFAAIWIFYIFFSLYNEKKELGKELEIYKWKYFIYFNEELEKEVSKDVKKLTFVFEKWEINKNLLDNIFISIREWYILLTNNRYNDYTNSNEKLRWKRFEYILSLNSMFWEDLINNTKNKKYINIYKLFIKLIEDFNLNEDVYIKNIICENYDEKYIEELLDIWILKFKK